MIDATQVYKWVVDDVITKCKPEFVQEGLDESLLTQLRSRWEQKLKDQGLLSDPLKPDEDGAGTSMAGDENGQTKRPSKKRKQADSAAQQQHQRTAEAEPGANVIPQHDGPADDDGPVGGDGGDGDGGADGGAAGADEQPAASDEVLSEDSDQEEDEEEDVTNFVCAQFDKVNRMKARWKVIMKDGVFHINGKDYLFKKCTGEFLWH